MDGGVCVFSLEEWSFAGCPIPYGNVVWLHASAIFWTQRACSERFHGGFSILETTAQVVAGTAPRVVYKMEVCWVNGR